MLIAFSGFWNRNRRGPLVAKVLQPAGGILTTAAKIKGKWPLLCYRSESRGPADHMSQQAIHFPGSLWICVHSAQLQKLLSCTNITSHQFFSSPLPSVLCHCGPVSTIRTATFASFNCIPKNNPHVKRKQKQQLQQERKIRIWRKKKLSIETNLLERWLWWWRRHIETSSFF